LQAPASLDPRQQRRSPNVIADKAAPCQHRPATYVARPRRTVSPSAAWAGGRAAPSTIKAIVMLALGVRGLVVVFDGLGRPWDRLVEALVLALLALAFVAAAARSCALRFGWLLSAGTATGLAIAATYGFVVTAGSPAVAATGVMVLLGILVICARAAARGR
jgi:hypothetical protein